MTWIFFTVLAAFSQAWRNAFQSKLSKTLNVTGVTLARFLWASPIAGVYLCSLYQLKPAALPSIKSHSVFFVFAAATMQIVATALMVVLFKQKNYAIGAGLAKSEAPVSAFLGVLFFGTTLSLTGWAGVLVGAVAVFLLSCPNGFRSVSLKTALLGLACSTAFALTSLWVREASLSLNLPFPHGAAWVLFSVISIQTIILTCYLLIKDVNTLIYMFREPKLVVMTSIASCIGSFGWFSAMSLKAVPYVKTLGQIEVFFMMLISFFWIKERIKPREVVALLLIAIAAILVMWH